MIDQPTIGDIDLHLIGEGRHERLWDVLGAHVGQLAGVTGTSFAVWAPNAREVRVAGDFNSWDGITHPLRQIGGGVWTTFVPGIGDGALYKFQILGADGAWREKADPMAQRTEVPPRTASVVYRSSYDWKDGDWLARRANTQAHREAMSIYEV
ncbi:MAG: 1,4-alpha-glucan branching protein GlgB, partial [Jiangellaceae bacterium]